MLVLGLCFAILTQSNFIQPNNETFWYPSHSYDIEWTNRGIVHLQLELYDNDTWSSDLVEEALPVHFLSIVSDHNLGKYTWTIPSYLSSYWNIDKRIKMTDLVNHEITYSDNFTIAGISVSPINNKIYSDSLQLVTWQSNSNTNTYNIYLLSSDTNYYNYIEENIIQVLASNVSGYIFNWLVPSNLDGVYRLGISMSNNKSWVISNDFEIETLTTSPTTTPTTTPTASPTTTPTTSPTTIPTRTPTTTPTTSPTAIPTTTPTTSPTNNITTCVNTYCMIEPGTSYNVWCNSVFYPSMCYAFCNNITLLDNCTDTNYTGTLNNYPNTTPVPNSTVIPCQKCVTEHSGENDDEDLKWYIWLIIALSILAVLSILIYFGCQYKKNNCRIQPTVTSLNQPNRTNCYNNPVYDDSGLERDRTTGCVNNPVYDTGNNEENRMVTFNRRTGTWAENVLYVPASVEAGIDFVRTRQVTVRK